MELFLSVFVMGKLMTPRTSNIWYNKSYIPHTFLFFVSPQYLRLCFPRSQSLTQSLSVLSMLFRLQVSLFRLQELKGDSMSTTSTSPNTPQMVNNTVHYLAQALAHIQQGIERKFLKAPLGRPAKLPLTS